MPGSPGTFLLISDKSERKKEKRRGTVDQSRIKFIDRIMIYIYIINIREMPVNIRFEL